MEYSERLRSVRSSTALRRALERPDIRPSAYLFERSDAPPSPKAMIKGLREEKQDFLSNENNRRHRAIRSVFAAELPDNLRPRLVMMPNGKFVAVRPTYDEDDESEALLALTLG